MSKHIPALPNLTSVFIVPVISFHMLLISSSTTLFFIHVFTIPKSYDSANSKLLSPASFPYPKPQPQFTISLPCLPFPIYLFNFTSIMMFSFSGTSCMTSVYVPPKRTFFIHGAFNL